MLLNHLRFGCRRLAVATCLRSPPSSAPIAQTLSSRIPFALTCVPHQPIRQSSSDQRWNDDSYERYQKRKTRDTAYYVLSVVVLAIGLTFAAVPAYRMFCESTAYGGTTQIAKDTDKIEKMRRMDQRLIRVQFNADTHSSMRWNFRPLQTDIYVHPGETALAFYTASNETNKPIIGMSTYNIIPFQAAYYFCKIQCFCFEEQILNPGEKVDMPVFFYIDPDYVDDPALEYTDDIILSYTFFEAKKGLKLPGPFDQPPAQKQIAPAAS
uniref:Cytochrome c oxidase assembly protein COX11, mitochondrial n=1 Tax=Plectus sambesii TaxID=2011161 RepID=A0A914XG29_9BILA